MHSIQLNCHVLLVCLVFRQLREVSRSERAAALCLKQPLITRPGADPPSSGGCLEAIAPTPLLVPGMKSAVSGIESSVLGSQSADLPFPPLIELAHSTPRTSDLNQFNEGGNEIQLLEVPGQTIQRLQVPRGQDLNELNEFILAGGGQFVK